MIGAAILATVLLANDMRNLKTILGRDAPVQAGNPPPPPPQRTALPPKPKPAAPPRFAAPRHAFDAPVPETVATFLRHWAISGADLCTRLSQAGLATEPWAPSGFDAATFECSHMSETAKPAGAGDPASLFLIARGTPSGAVTNLRIKLILPEGDAGKPVGEQFAAVLALLARESRWSDLPFTQVGSLQDATQAAFGAKLSFAHEFDDPRRFNFILSLERDTPEQRRTGAYFDREKWLPLPPTATS